MTDEQVAEQVKAADAALRETLTRLSATTASPR